MISQFHCRAFPPGGNIFFLLLLLMAVVFLSSPLPGAAQVEDDTAYTDEAEPDDGDPGVAPEAEATEEEADQPVQDDDLAEMQRRINQINQDPVQQAAELMQQAQSNPEGVQNLLASQMGGSEDSSYSSPLYWFFMIFVSVVGMGFFMSGKSSGDFGFMLSGAVLSIFPYFVTNVWVFALVGIALIILPFTLRRF